MSDNPICFILVGIPCSGKSTVADSIEKVFEENPYFDLTVISTDRYIDKVAEQTGKTYSEVWKDTIEEASRAQRERFEWAIKQGRDILFDQTNLTVKSRTNKIYNQLPKNYEIRILYFPASVEVCLERNRNRSRSPLPESIIRQMNSDLQIPELSEDNRISSIGPYLT